jgi:glycosyltransferase involved in cell wall biosynthesis
MYEMPSITFPFYKDYRLPVVCHSAFQEQLREFKPHILHINSPCPLGFAALTYGLKHRIPVVATYHTHFVSYAKYYKVKALESVSWNYFRKIYNDCELVYVPSKPILEELESHGFNKLKYLPHGVDLEVFNPEYYSGNWRQKYNLEGKILLLYAGRLVWEKDLKTLAGAYKILKEKRNDVKFIIAGDGPVKEQLMAEMPDAVFLGHVSGIELSTAYASNDIFVFPSTTETFGNVTLEAMASGLAPVCVREGGAYGVIEDGKTGLIAKPRDPFDLAEKIETLADYPLKRKKIAYNALNYAKEQSWQKIFQELFRSYNEVVMKYSHGFQNGRHYKRRSFSAARF